MSADRGKLLLAQDEQTPREVLADRLRRVGFLVETVSNSHVTMEALGIRALDVLLADLDLPGNAPQDLQRFVRQAQATLPVVLMTAHPTVDSAVEAFRLGVVDYITKPIHVRKLVARLDIAITKSRALQAFAGAEQRALAFAESAADLEHAVAVFSSAAAANPRPPSESPTDPLARLNAQDMARLSPRELEITRLFALGSGVSAVATTLRLSPNTVRNHVKSVFVKLRVHSQVAFLSKLAGH